MVDALVHARASLPDVPRQGKKDKVWIAQHKCVVNQENKHCLSGQGTGFRALSAVEVAMKGLE